MVSERSVESSSDSLPPLDAIGDVLSARRLALSLLSNDFGVAAESTLVVLLLTAACLAVHANAAGDLDMRDLARFLRRMPHEDPPARLLAASTSQFAQYAAHEYRRCPSAERAALANYLADTVETRRGPYAS